MYKVLICDDEKMGIKSLIATVNWAKNGFEIVAEAYDGLSALDLILQMRPDLVFTDIRMPGMTGLELMKKVNSLNLKTLFVTISGYAEFAYVQKALNCGAVGYCLKPFEESEITNILKKAKHSLDISRDSLETELLSLISERKSDKKDRKIEILKLLGFEWTESMGITTVVVKGPKIAGFLSDINSAELRLGNSQNAYLIQTSDLTVVERKITEYMKNVDIVVGISNPCYQLQDLYSCIYNDSIAADQKFMTGKNGIYYYQDLVQIDFNSILSKLQLVLAKRDFTETMRFFDFIEEEFSKGGYSVKHAFKLYNVIIYSSQTINISISQFMDDYKHLIETFSNVSEMLAYLRNMLVEPIGVYNQNIALEVKNETFRNIINYVNEDFFENLSIQTIARKFTINPNYVSQLFKKETGVTFTEYLTNLRVNFAICMLKTTDLPVNTVAEKSGFGDYFYFTRVFKKNTGKTPTEYRTQYSSGKQVFNTKKYM